MLSAIRKHTQNKIRLKSGSQAAIRVFDRYIDYLAAGFYGIVKVFRPDVIVIAGAITNDGDTIRTPLNEKLDEIVEVRISQFKNDAGIIGAALL